MELFYIVKRCWCARDELISIGYFSVTPKCMTIPPSLKGDLNLDGRLTSADSAIALRIAVSGEYVPEADIDGNGCVTSLDILMIAQGDAAGRIEL